MQLTVTIEAREPWAQSIDDLVLEVKVPGYAPQSSGADGFDEALAGAVAQAVAQVTAAVTASRALTHHQGGG